MTSSIALVYDAWNRLVEVQTTTRTIQKNEFDGLHRRIVRSLYTTAGAVDYHIHYYYNQKWQVVEERKEPSGGVIDTDPINQYVWHPDYIDSLAMRRHDGNVDGAIVGAGEGKHYYLQDANFNVTAVVNDAGAVLERYAYTPYGTPTILSGAADADAGVSDFSVDANQQSDISNVILYTGRERDPETGLQLNRRRFYASHLGRWLTRDPIGYDGGTLNLYEYVNSRPTIAYDPFGEKSWTQWIIEQIIGEMLPGDGTLTNPTVLGDAEIKRCVRECCYNWDCEAEIHASVDGMRIGRPIIPSLNSISLKGPCVDINP